MNPKRPTSSGKQPSRFSRQKARGFSALNPSKMGFDVPDWMEPSVEAIESADVDLDDSKAENGITPPLSSGIEERTLLEGLKVVCICKGIKKRVFWKALDDGIETKEEINRCTGSGSGGCQGRRCGPRILDMLRNASL